MPSGSRRRTSARHDAGPASETGHEAKRSPPEGQQRVRTLTRERAFRPPRAVRPCRKMISYREPNRTGEPECTGQSR